MNLLFVFLFFIHQLSWLDIVYSFTPKISTSTIPSQNKMRPGGSLNAIIRSSLLDSTQDPLLFPKDDTNYSEEMFTIATSNPDDKSENERWKWRAQLLQIANIASFLCVLDCTILPIITLLLPLVGIGGSTFQPLLFLHKLEQPLALFFVLPVGSLTTYMNFRSHRKASISSLAIVGMLMIFLANGSEMGPLLSLLPHDIDHALHCGGIAHRVCNTSGSSLLLLSNFVSHKAMNGCAYDSLDLSSEKKRSGQESVYQSCCNVLNCMYERKEKNMEFFSWK